MEKYNLAAYLTGGVENIVKNILRATLKDPRESAFMLKYSLASREAIKRRTMYEARGIRKRRTSGAARVCISG